MAVVKRISQEAFDEAVKVNVADFDMEPDEAVQAAIEEFEIQKIDLTGINKTFHANRQEHPIVAAVAKLHEAVTSVEGTRGPDSIDLSTAMTEISSLATMNEKGDEFVAEAISVAAQKAVVPMLLKALEALEGNEEGQILGLQTLSTLLVTDPHREAFDKSNGTKAMCSILKSSTKGPLAAAALSTAAQSAFKNEDNKASFVTHGGDDLILAALREPDAETASLIAACTALRSVTLADDDRPCLSSGAFKTAREICTKGAAPELLRIIKGAETDNAPLAAAACSALRRVSVTDEICKDIADNQGVELLLAVIKSYPDNAHVTRTSLSVMRQLANSDANKNLIISRGGLAAVKSVAASGVAGSCEQALGLIVSLALRNPDGANAAVEAGCVNTIAQVMSALPGEQWVQRQGCMAVRNLVSRTPEHKQAFLDAGIEALLRKAQTQHPQACKDVGGAALRDLGFENYDLGELEIDDLPAIKMQNDP